MTTQAAERSDRIIAYLKANAPDIAAILEKNLTAGDVHATTALGNEDDKTKSKKPFAALVEQAKQKREADTVDKKGDVPAEWSLPLEIIKADPEQQLIFGWASVVEKDGKPIVDKQGDVIDPEELEKAAYDFSLYSRSQGDMHERIGTGRMVESMVFSKQKQTVLGIDLGIVGWWVGFKVDDPKLWAAHKRGERPEFSIGGHGVRVPITTA